MREGMIIQIINLATKLHYHPNNVVSTAEEKNDSAVYACYTQQQYLQKGLPCLCCKKILAKKKKPSLDKDFAPVY